MKKIIQHPVYGEIVYTENFWTGRKTLTVGGETQRVSKKEFVIEGKRAVVKGNLLMGGSLLIEDESFELTPKTSWYEYLLAILPLVFVMGWGNSPALCAIFPVIGGAVGGFIGALGMCLSMLFMKKTSSVVAKVSIGIGMLLGTAMVSFILAFIFVLLMVL